MTRREGGEDVSAESSAAGFQPFLHDRVIIIAAPSLVVSGPDGQIGDPLDRHGRVAGDDLAGPDGLFHADRRLLSRLQVFVTGLQVAPIQTRLLDASSARFWSVVRGAGESGPDPVCTLTRTRRVANAGFSEEIVIANAGNRQVELEVEFVAGTDTGSMEAVKSGVSSPELTATATADGLDWRGSDGRASIALKPPPDRIDSARGSLAVRIALQPGTSWTGTLHVEGEGVQPPLFASASGDAPWAEAFVTQGDGRLAPLLARSLDDLRSLLLSDPAPAPFVSPTARPTADRFLAAGAPWYLTLFGRDSLWAARMMLPLGTDLAADTLRVLARRQGRVTDQAIGEEPGKILHELRPPRVHDDRPDHGLPPVYYGTVDATALWLILLHDSWRWGLAEDQIEPLLDAAEAAAGWMRAAAAADPAGFIRYHDHSGRGLANQGWRDSSDSIRWTDGRLAEPPIALGEVQAYAYEAAVGATALLERFGRPGAGQWRDWAEALKARYHASFWVDEAQRPYPATALDTDGGRVDSLTSSLGHLLGTGLLDAGQAALVAGRLADADLDAGLGLHTLSRHAVGFNPLGYHTGSIWPHDTMIAAHGLWREGHDAVAWSLIDGLLTAAGPFEQRLPEVFAGLGPDIGPAPYPASCRPQAWAAAASVAALAILAGLEPDVPAGRLHLRPLRQPILPLHLSGPRVAGQAVEVHVDRDGRATANAPTGLVVTTS